MNKPGSGCDSGNRVQGFGRSTQSHEESSVYADHLSPLQAEPTGFLDTPLPPVAVVTGGSRGVGRALVAKLEAHGFIVFAAQRSALDNHNDPGGRSCRNVKSCHLDLADPQSVERLAEYLTELLPSIDLLINNAAICPTQPRSENEIAVYWREVMNINFHAPVRLTEKLLPLLHRSRRHPRVVNISSGDGELLYFSESIRACLEELPECQSTRELADATERIVAHILETTDTSARQELIACGQPAYKLSKAALNAYTRFASRHQTEIGSTTGVRFLSICPGDVDTAMADDTAQLIPPEEAVRRMQKALDVNQSCRTGVFLRYGKQIPW